MGETNPLLILPFAVMLGAMALGPVVAPNWWRRHYSKLALGLATLMIAIYLFWLRDVHALAEVAHEYVSFIIIGGALFVVAGGISLQVKSRATPIENVLFLLAGAVVANVLGTTGAAMLLIRPWLRVNQARLAPYHVVFFIFLVANVGGCLTPIGDPPLFLGYLQGIPFWWVLEHCWPLWVTAVGLLLALFYVIDRFHWARHRPTSPVMENDANWKFAGGTNLFFLAVILGAVFIEHPPFLRELIMVAAAAGSYFSTKKSVHAANSFNFHPINEVAILFAGIFATMIPAMAWLKQHADVLLGQNPSPGIFYWGTGALSAILDNAPTYLGFLSALGGRAGNPEMATLLAHYSGHLLAISAGAVFFGAATYIGNGPNFMVKTVAEQCGARVPAFLEYVWKFSLSLLLPVLVVVWIVFLARAN